MDPHKTSGYQAVYDLVRNEYKIDATDMTQQALISNKIDDRIFDRWWQSLPSAHRSRVNSQLMYGASSWVNCLPQSRHYMEPNTMLLVLRMHLGIPIIAKDSVQLCRACDDELDIYGWHGTKCMANGNGELFSVTKRHNNVRDTVHYWFNKSHYSCEKEKYGLCPGNERPADVCVERLYGSRGGCLDVGITNPFGSTPADPTVQGEAARKYADVKRSKYRLLDENRLHFEPLIFETYGGFGEEAIKVLKRLAYDLRGVLNASVSEIIQDIRREIVVSILSDNAKLVAQRYHNVVSIQNVQMPN